MVSSTVDSIGDGSPFDVMYRRLLWSVDVLGGDNPKSNSITDHGMVDADARKFEIDDPDVYLAKMNDGSSNGDLNARFSLLNHAERLRAILSDGSIDPVRKGVLLREIHIADLRLRDILSSEVEGVTRPTFQQNWEAITGTEPPTIASMKGEIEQIHGRLFALLQRKGLNLGSAPLTFWVDEWEKSLQHYGVANADAITGILRTTIGDFFGQFCSFTNRIPALKPFVGELSIDRHEIAVLPDMNFDAGLSYIGGSLPNGRPSLAARFEWNAGRPATAVDIQYVGIHEFIHALNAQLMDLQRRAGLLGPESALLTMSSCRVCVEEGFAQTGLEMLYGGFNNVVDALGIDMGITMLLDQLQDIARLAVAVGWNVDFAEYESSKRLEKLHDVVRYYLLQNEHIAHKYAGLKKRFWRETTGGNMYAPAYWVGSRAFRKALEQHTAEEVFAVATHSRGLVDLDAFNQLLPS